MTNARGKTHLCLVSAQATPNLTPLLDPATRPDEVVFLVSEDMQQRAGWLEDIIRPRGIKSSRWHIDDPWDIESLRDRILGQLIERDDHQAFVLNATGGTKPMSIAAYEVFRGLELPIYYVHPDHDRLIWLYPRDRAAIDLADRLKLEAFLAAHGTQVEGAIERQGLTDQQRAICSDLVFEIGRFSNPLGSLNWLANSAEGSLKSRPLKELKDQGADLKQLIDRFAADGFFKIKDNRLIFADEDQRFFVNGGWLELYVFDLCAQLRKECGLQDLGRNIQVNRTQRGQRIPNEIDVACLANNRLYLFECKTKKWDEKQAPGAEALYRLDTLKDLLGGLGARAMLVSYQELPDHDKRRAADLRIQVCAGPDLPRLKEKLRENLGVR